MYNGMIMGVFAGRIAAIKEKLALSDTQISLILISFSIGCIIAMSMLKELSAKYGSKKVLFFTCLMASISFYFFINIPNSLILLILITTMSGSFVGAMDVSMNAQAVLLETKISKAIMSSLHGMWSLGMFIGSYLLTIALKYNLNITLLIMPIVMALCIFNIYNSKNLFDDRMQLTDRDEKSRKLFSLPHRQVIPIGALIICFILPEAGLTEWSGIWLTDKLYMGVAWEPRGVMIISFFMMIARFSGDYIVNMLGRKQFIWLSSIFTLFAILTVILSPYTNLTLLAFAVFGLSIANMMPILYSMAGRVQGVTTAEGVAGATTMGYAAYMLSPAIIGVISDAFGLQFSFLFLACLVISALFLARFVLEKA